MITNPATMRFHRLEKDVTQLLNHIDSLELGDLILFASNADKDFIEFDERPKTGHTKPEIARNTKFIVFFGKIIEKFDTFQVDFKKSPVEECVEQYFNKFISLLVPGVPIHGSKEFMDQYREHNESIKRTTIKKGFGRRCECLVKMELDDEKLMENDDVVETTPERQLLINRIDVNNSRQKAWKKWLEFRGLLEDGIQLLRGLEAWKEWVAERLSSFPLRIFKTQTVFPNINTPQGRIEMKTTILKVIESFELNWNVFKNTSTSFVPLTLIPLSPVEEGNEGGLDDRSSSAIVIEDENEQEGIQMISPVPNNAPASIPVPNPPQLPPRFAVNSLLSQNQLQLFATPNPSFSHLYSQQQPVLWNNSVQTVQNQAVPLFPPHPSHPIQAPFGYNPRMPPNMTRYAPYPPPLMFNRNLNLQNLQNPNAPNHWNAPFGFPPMNSLPVLRPIQNLGQNYLKPAEVETNTDDEEMFVEYVENQQLSPFINVVD